MTHRKLDISNFDLFSHMNVYYGSLGHNRKLRYSSVAIFWTKRGRRQWDKKSTLWEGLHLLHDIGKQKSKSQFLVLCPPALNLPFSSQKDEALFEELRFDIYLIAC